MELTLPLPCASSFSSLKCSCTFGKPCLFPVSRKSASITLSSNLTNVIRSSPASIFCPNHGVLCKSGIVVSLFPLIRKHGPLCVPLNAKSKPSQPLEEDLEDFPDTFRPESEEEARRIDWVERGWAPWEHILSPEAQFAVDSLRDGEEESIVPLESFRKLSARLPQKMLEKERQEVVQPEESDSQSKKEELSLEGTLRTGPFVFSLIPPRDWPPPGWKVDSKELAFIREAHDLENVRIAPEDLENAASTTEVASLERWEMFLKQYHHWVAANKDSLDQEVLEMDEEYYPGRRRIGENYKEGMYELPFIYPGQHYWGVVTCVNLYEGAFVYYGGVHDGWVPIRDNDWYEIRNHIKVGMTVQVEVMAKRDPYIFRFPVEMHFVIPNIDSLIFKRFKSPPIFARPEDTNLDEVARASGRAYWPKLRPESKNEEDLEIVNHPYLFKAWQIHIAEQMVLDHEDGSDIYVDSDGVVLEDLSEGDWDFCGSKKDTFLTEDFKPEDYNVPKPVLNQDEQELDLEAARAEREVLNKLWEEAKSKGEVFEIPKLKKAVYLEELQAMHRQRIIEEVEALQRDKSCRMEFGLPLEEPGRYADLSFFAKDPYDPRDKRWRHDYFGDPAKRKEEVKKDKEPRPCPAEVVVEEEEKNPRSRPPGAEITENDLSEELRNKDDQIPGNDVTSNEQNTSVEGTRLVNGTESLRIIDIKGMFDNKGNWENEDGKENSGEDESKT